MNKKYKILTFIIIILTILVIGLISYIIYNKILKENNTTINNDTNKQHISYNINDYISLEEVDLNNNNINLNKIVFKNIDESLSKPFLDAQDELIESINKINYEYLTASSSAWYQINGNILTVYYKITYTVAIGTCPTILVTNIDLLNKKVLTNKELLEMGNTSFHDIALSHYNKTLESVNKCNEPDSICAVLDKDYNKITVSDYTENKDNYIYMIESGLDNVINCYIEDGIIKYDYYGFSIDTLYLGIGKGGCFNYITVEVAQYE